MNEAAPEGPNVSPHHPHGVRSGPPSKLARNLVVGALIVMVAAANLGNAFLPVLLTEHPLWFIALNPSNRSLALASGELSAWSFYTVGFLRLVAPDPLFYLLGVWYGDAAIRWMERRAPSYGELLRQLERGFDRAQIPVVAIAPNNPVCLFAGAAGMSVGIFALANAVGTIGRLVLIRLFSNAFEGPLGSLRSFIGRYQIPLLVLSLGMVAFTMLRDRRGGKEGISDLANLPEDIEEIEQELEAEDEHDAAAGTPPTWIVHPDEAFEHHTDPHHLRYRVAGSPVHVTCEDTELVDRAEAWGTAFALPAARAGAALELPTAPDPAWVAGVQANVARAAEWWGGATSVTIRPEPAAAAEPTGAAPGRAIAFTAGVDSFFSLLRGNHRPTHLLFVLGYDVDLAHTERCEASEATVRAVADEVGLAPLVLSTDLRHHPEFSAISWEHTHGAAIAAAGILVAGTIGTLIVPPSFYQRRLVPWGSRPDLDPGWSVPGRLTVEHGDNSGSRLDRVLAIADEPIVHRHLRVCWSSSEAAPNCGTCEKCLRTMAQFELAGRLADCQTFPGREHLVETISTMPPIPEVHIVLWQDLLDGGVSGALADAVSGLIARSTP